MTAILLHPFLLYIGYPILILASWMAWNDPKWFAAANEVET